MFFINPFIYGGGGDFESIATVTVGSGGASSVVFDNIPSTYQHLQIRGLTPLSIRDAVVLMRFNSDTGSNYRYHSLNGNGSSASALTNSGTSLSLAYDWNASTNTSTPRAVVMDILDYAVTTKNTVTRAFCGADSNGSGNVVIDSGLWMSTSAVSTITLTQSGYDGSSYGVKNFAQYSTFALFGVKAP